MTYYPYTPYRYPSPVMHSMKYRNQKNNYTNSKNLKGQHNSSMHEHFEEPKKPIEKIKEKPIKTDEKPLFEIFGIKLFFDDILLICLIFFLYNEGVQDQYLFIALILLLLS